MLTTRILLSYHGLFDAPSYGLSCSCTSTCTQCLLTDTNTQCFSSVCRRPSDNGIDQRQGPVARVSVTDHVLGCMETLPKRTTYQSSEAPTPVTNSSVLTLGIGPLTNALLRRFLRGLQFGHLMVPAVWDPEPYRFPPKQTPIQVG